MAFQIFKYRGMVERWVGKGTKRKLRWKEGYSEDGESGPCYPWMTRTECREYAEKFGHSAKFQKDNPKFKFKVIKGHRVEYEAVRVGKCGCGKTRRQKMIFWRKDDFLGKKEKSRDAIFKELIKESQAWEKAPITCDSCK